MLLSEPKHQLAKSFRDFIYKLPWVVLPSPREVPSAPHIPFVLRVGMAGPLHLYGEHADLSVAVNAILLGLKSYADDIGNPSFRQRMYPNRPASPAEVRIVGQLASGFDQMAAQAAIDIGYKLHVVLPGGRVAFRHDIQRNLDHSAADRGGPAGSSAVAGPTRADQPAIEADKDPLSRFDALLAQADRVLELDRDHDGPDDTTPFTYDDYKQAVSVILDHSDVVLVAVHDEAASASGGSQWIAEQADERDVIVIHVPLNRPFEALLIWTEDTRRECRRIFEAGAQDASSQMFASVLDRQLLGPAFEPPKAQMGWFERRLAVQLKPEKNAEWWDKRRKIDGADMPAAHDLGIARDQIDADIKPAKVWADNRGSALAELVRGSMIVSALLGVAAVFFALIGVIFHAVSWRGGGVEVSFWGKVCEVLCLGVIFWFIGRSRRYDWRSHWLSVRQLERYLEQVAWLLLLGRVHRYATPSHLVRFQTDDISRWINAYFVLANI